MKMCHLQCGPVMCEDHKGVLEADHDGQDHPGDHEALEEGRASMEDVTQVACLASLEAADDEEEAADGTEEGAEDGVLDEGTDANIFSLHMSRKKNSFK